MDVGIDDDVVVGCTEGVPLLLELSVKNSRPTVLT
jgi:hypothetical protein